MEYQNFDLQINHQIGRNSKRRYPVSVVLSPAGEAKTIIQFPFNKPTLIQHLNDIQQAVLNPEGEQVVRNFGEALFDTLLSGEIRSRYDVSRQKSAEQRNAGLRIRLRISDPELAALPWEFLFDSRNGEYICLSQRTPVIRYLELPQPVESLLVAPPLRILGMIVNTGDQILLNTEQEKQRMQASFRDLQARGLVELTWIEGQTWRDLMQTLRKGDYHIFHFIGHGGFNPSKSEGFIELADEDGRVQMITATQLGILLADHQFLRLVFLNTCKGAKSSTYDVFSSTSTTLARRGIPAVIAMQYEITDHAAIELTRTFYESLAEGMPVDAAITEARKAISLEVGTLEWGTPVLYMRSQSGIIFNLAQNVSPETERLLHKDFLRSTDSLYRQSGHFAPAYDSDSLADEEGEKSRHDDSLLIKIASSLKPNQLEIVLGVYENEEYKVTALPETGNILLAGGKGIGKTNGAMFILAQLCTKNDPQVLHVALLDLDLQKGLSSRIHSIHAPFRQIRLTATNIYEAEYFLLDLEQELDRRRLQMSKNDPAWLVVIEAFTTLQPNKNVWRALNSLALLGPKHAIYLLATTRSNTLPEELLVAFETRLIFKPSLTDSPEDNTEEKAMEHINELAETPIIHHWLKQYTSKIEARCDLCRERLCAYILEDYVDFQLSLAQQTSGLIILEEFDKRSWQNTVLEQVTRGPHKHRITGLCRNCALWFVDTFMNRNGIGNTLLSLPTPLPVEAQRSISFVLFKQFGNPDLPIMSRTVATTIKDLLEELKNIQIENPS
jgi:CHAT domain